ncbi:MAG: tetratricopeptide repeat protein [Anaerolineae bacterium]|nr:tetratricopeptide repeat protein [Anaerolineae bacterium]
MMGLAGAFLFRLGDYQRAMDWCTKSMDILENLRPHIAYAHTLVYAGAAAFGLDNIESAINYWKKAIEEYRAAGSIWGESTSRVNLSEALIAMGMTDDAKTHALEALSLGNKMNNAEIMGSAFTNLALISVEEKDFSEGTRRAEQALANFQKRATMRILPIR